MDTYYETPGGGFGVVDDVANVPEGATVITLQIYQALQQSAAQAEVQRQADEQLQRETQWTTVHDALVAGGVTDPAASILADVVGTNPAP